jgi:hypothetical protein
LLHLIGLHLEGTVRGYAEQRHGIVAPRNFLKFRAGGSLRTVKFGVKGPTQPFALIVTFSRVFKYEGVKGPSETRNFGPKGGKISHRGESSKRAQEFFSDGTRGDLVAEVRRSHIIEAELRLGLGEFAELWIEDEVRVDRASNRVRSSNEVRRDRRTRSVIEVGKTDLDDRRSGMVVLMPYDRQIVETKSPNSELDTEIGRVTTMTDRRHRRSSSQVPRSRTPISDPRSQTLHPDTPPPPPPSPPGRGPFGARTGLEKKSKKVASEGPGPSPFSPWHRCENIGHTWPRKKR